MVSSESSRALHSTTASLAAGTWAPRSQHAQHGRREEGRTTRWTAVTHLVHSLCHVPRVAAGTAPWWSRKRACMAPRDLSCISPLLPINMMEGGGGGPAAKGVIGRGRRDYKSDDVYIAQTTWSFLSNGGFWYFFKLIIHSRLLLSKVKLMSYIERKKRFVK